MELEYLLQSRIFAAESLQKGFQCLPGSLGIVLMIYFLQNRQDLLPVLLPDQASHGSGQVHPAALMPGLRKFLFHGIRQADQAVRDE